MEERFGEVTSSGELKVMYTIDGVSIIPETILSHLEGYAMSQPVRVGNAAAKHFQLDIYGEVIGRRSLMLCGINCFNQLLDAAYLLNKFVSPIGYDLWCLIRSMVNFVVENWHKPDMSIWETRGEKKCFTYSKVMCW